MPAAVRAKEVSATRALTNQGPSNEQAISPPPPPQGSRAGAQPGGVEQPLSERDVPGRRTQPHGAMAPKAKSKEPPPPAEPPEEDLGPLPVFDFAFLPVVTRTLAAEDVPVAELESWVCDKSKLATRLSIADALVEAQADGESELSVAVAAAKQRDQESGKEFR